MQVVKANQSGLRQAVAIIKKNGVIVYPTETSYGLGGFFDSAAVMRKVLSIKKRRDKKFVLVASSLNQVKKFFCLNAVENKLAKKYWPGPLSIVVNNNFSIRVPDNKIARYLAQKSGKPLIATSANISGKSAAYGPNKIIKYFAKAKNQPDLFVNVGQLKKSRASTLVKVRKNKVLVLRRGQIIL